MLLTLFSYQGNAQQKADEPRNTYMDAAELAWLFYENSKCEGCLDMKQRLWYLALLKEYTNGDSIEQVIARNPFLNDKVYFLKGFLNLKTNDTLKNTDVDGGKTHAKSLEFYSPTSRAVNWSNDVIQGLADFVGERFKEDVTNYGLFQITSRLSRSEGMEILFPATCRFIKSLGRDTYYFSDLNLLRATAEIDLKRMPKRIPKYLAKKELNVSKEFENEMVFIVQAIDYAKQASNPTEAVDLLFESYNEEGKLKQGLDLVRIMMHAVTVPSDYGNELLTPAQLSLRKVETRFDIRFFYGLLYEQCRLNPLFSTPDKVDAFSDMFLTTLTRIQALKSTHDQLSEKSELKYMDYKLYTLRIVDLIRPFLSDKAANITDKVLELTAVIEAKEYIQVVPVIMDLLLESDAVVLQDTDREFLRLLSFTVGIIRAESPDDIKELIKMTALPVGSSALKRSGKWDLSLNAFVGVTSGLERLKADNKTSSYLNAGLSAPLGITLSKRISSKKPGSLTMFASVLDVGALLNQGTADSVQSDLDIRIEQFFSPGLGLFYNFGRSPFTLGVHAYYAPAIRQTFSKSNGITITSGHQDVWRINFSVLMDIPVLNLWHKTHQPKPEKTIITVN